MAHDFISLLSNQLLMHCFAGVDRLGYDISLMIGSRPGFFWKISWKFTTPAIMLVSSKQDIIRGHFIDDSVHFSDDSRKKGQTKKIEQ